MARFTLTGLTWVVAILVSGGVPAGAGPAGFREHRVPEEFVFNAPTPALDPADPTVELGRFQPGVRVRVLGLEPQHPGSWRVRFEARGAAPVEALVPVAVSAAYGGRSWAEALELLGGFPLLLRLLEHPTPWTAPALVETGTLLSPAPYRRVVSHAGTVAAAESRWICGDLSSNRVWQLEPIEAFLDFSNPARVKYTLEFWSKGKSLARPGFQGEPERNALRRRLEQLARIFDPSGNSVRRERGSNALIRGLRDNVEYYFFPNDVRVALHFHHGEYLFVELEQASLAESQGPQVRSAAELARHLRGAVTGPENGFRYIRGIPMFDQGQTAYCVPATMARVLNFYGFDVHTHALAMLARTHEQRDALGGGTSRADMMAAMRRITDGSPFRLREIPDTRPDTLRRAILEGLPIIWLIPGHMRLIIGLDDAAGSIVYSDTWGLGHEFKVMPYSEFETLNVGMWVLEPR